MLFNWAQTTFEKVSILLHSFFSLISFAIMLFFPWALLMTDIYWVKCFLCHCYVQLCSWEAFHPREKKGFRYILSFDFFFSAHCRPRQIVFEPIIFHDLHKANRQHKVHLYCPSRPFHKNDYHYFVTNNKHHVQINFNWIYRSTTNVKQSIQFNTEIERPFYWN